MYGRSVDIYKYKVSRSVLIAVNIALVAPTGLIGIALLATMRLRAANERRVDRST
jgi:hypothetical protein